MSCSLICPAFYSGSSFYLDCPLAPSHPHLHLQLLFSYCAHIYHVRLSSSITSSLKIFPSSLTIKIYHSFLYKCLVAGMKYIVTNFIWWHCGNYYKCLNLLNLQLLKAELVSFLLYWSKSSNMPCTH